MGFFGLGADLATQPTPGGFDARMVGRGEDTTHGGQEKLRVGVNGLNISLAQP